ncbi:hypothetical protein AXE80_05575 [Wenyingzhuangia fucanilytica]|uniref:Uncharacterized protein n=1 Tax=Wenyingzhuangia fucanilytica TaxID=1790137 RepID=A0A1B1Y4T1_9FLAO|nr:hypothetical protein [Wenyingzhuangia fucanilytica]ANW95782.1 hypothetical protein AXE80_05575 [Wenyingzhuangia fucanilytica]
MKKKHIYIIGAVVLFLPLWMWLFWLFTPKTHLLGSIVDKTVLTNSGQEHISLTWMLNHKKLTKTPTKLYKVDHDYFGFFPKEDEKFRTKGLERFTGDQLEKLSKDVDFAYYTDTYGIYNNEWYTKDSTKIRYGKLYGGLSQEDLEFLTHMKAKKKLILAEFNTIASPTTLSNRRGFEKLFGMQWTGWTGRYFDSFDTIKNLELPKWLVKNYEKYNDEGWKFKKSGIAFVNNGGRVVVLEDSLDLNKELPYIHSGKKGQEQFGLPEKIKYSFWFDIINIDPNVNEIISGYQLEVNEHGAKKLKANKIPKNFPAVIRHKRGGYRFYYFSGDFSDNPISITSSYFKGIEYFKWMFFDESRPMERKSFFWQFYFPLLNTILDEEQLILNK